MRVYKLTIPLLALVAVAMWFSYRVAFNSLLIGLDKPTLKYLFVYPALILISLISMISIFKGFDKKSLFSGICLVFNLISLITLALLILFFNRITISFGSSLFLFTMLSVLTLATVAITLNAFHSKINK